jgi:hypothetical protein
MTVFADLEPCTYFGDDAARVLRSVGWIGEQGFPSGRIDVSVYRRLVDLFADAFQPVIAAGMHACSVCQFEPEASGGRNLFVPTTDVVYVCPELVLHYINAHHYAPPREFCAAVMTCPHTRSMDYKKRLLAAGGKVLLDWAG